MVGMYQLGDDLAFERCLPDTLKEEGGYSNDAHDPGGMTMEGIIQREYDKWRLSRGLPTRWVKQIGDDEMRTIYRDEYWLPLCPSLPAGLDLCVFDTNVNNGVHAGMVLLQRALLVTADGIWGTQSYAAVTALGKSGHFVQMAIARYYAARRAYYLSLKNFQYFGTDWLRRDLDIEQEALAMAGGA